MKKCFYCLTALLFLAGCEGLLKDSDKAGGGGGDTPQAGDETVSGVTQPKGAIKRIFDVQTDSRDWHLFDFDDVYAYDAQGRVVTDICDEKTYEGSTGKIVFNYNYEYTYHYDGTRYEWWNSPSSKDKAQEGTLNAKGQLVSLKRLASGGTVIRTDTFTYDAEGHLTKFVKDFGDGDKTTFTYTWADGNMVASVKTVTSGSTTVSTEQYHYNYSRDPNPTRGHFFDLQHKCCFPDTNQSMMLGLGPKNLLTSVYILNTKVNLGLISRHYSYEWNDARTQIVKMVRTVLDFPCEEEEIIRKERTIDTFTFEYYE